MILTPQDILYITLSIFVAITGTLLSIVLYKLIRILGVFEEITGYYYTVKQALHAYDHIPAVIIETIKDFASKTTTKLKRKKSV